MACIEVIEWPLVEVIRSCSWPISSASVGWYPTADGIRPSSVDTSEPAWVNRKMLSMNRSTSCSFTSRKYSAMVSADSPTRSRTPGGSSIWPKTSAVSWMTFDVVNEQEHVLLFHVAEVLGHGQRGQPDPQPDARRLVHLAEDQRGVLDDLRLRHLDEQVVALTGPLADPGEHRHAAEVLGHPGDHLLDEHRLAHPGPAEQADLPALDVRREQVEHLDAGLHHLGSRLKLVERGRVPVDSPALGDIEGRDRHIQRVAQHVEHMALGDVPHRHRNRPPGVGHRRPAHQAIGLLHGDGADHIVTDVLFHLQGQRPHLVVQRHVHVQGVVDAGQFLRGEFHVDDGTDHPHDAAGTSAGLVLAAGSGLLYGFGHDAHSFPASVSASALAPPTISLISWVISACRALFASRVNCSSRSLALSVADFIARRRAAISDAALSSNAW